MDKYKVEHLLGGHWHVTKKNRRTIFSGSISDCYAFIRLAELNIIEYDD